MQHSPEPPGPPQVPFPQQMVAAPERPAPPRRNARGLIIGLGVGLASILLIGFVTVFLLYTRAPQGVGATWAITIADARTTDGGSVAATALPPGDTYLAIDITVKNVAGNPHDFAGYIDFTVKDATGMTYATTYLPGPDIIDGTIPGGTSKSGTIAFAVPASQHTFTLIYADPSYGTQQWSLTV